jgi:homoserine kinase
MRNFAVSVPASSANLGPGFDAIGLALDVRIHATVTVRDDAGANVLTFPNGRYVPTHDGLADEIRRGIARVVGQATVPAIDVAIRNDIPLGKGLGGSAAGAVLGVAIGARLLPAMPSDAALAQIVAEIEGHPDNALPALFGGIVIAAQTVDEPLMFLRFAAPPRMNAIVIVPQIEMPTAEARAILPASYSKRDAVFNIQRAALLGAALASGRTEMLRTAMADRIHQPYRASFVPGLAAMLALDDPNVLGIALSGAGPSVIALVDGDGSAVGGAMQRIFTERGITSTRLALAIASRGVIEEEA